MVVSSSIPCPNYESFYYNLECCGDSNNALCLWRFSFEWMYVLFLSPIEVWHFSLSNLELDRVERGCANIELH